MIKAIEPPKIKPVNPRVQEFEFTRPVMVIENSSRVGSAPNKSTQKEPEFNFLNFLKSG